VCFVTQKPSSWQPIRQRLITTHALNAQGLDGFDILVNLTDKDVKEMCANVRKPGGTILNPAFDAAGNPPVARVAATIPNPGVLMGLPHEKLLRQLRYYHDHMNRIQREFTRCYISQAHRTLALQGSN
jgi:hypothetical protein